MIQYCSNPRLSATWFTRRSHGHGRCTCVLATVSVASSMNGSAASNGAARGAACCGASRLFQIEAGKKKEVPFDMEHINYDELEKEFSKP